MKLPVTNLDTSVTSWRSNADRRDAEYIPMVFARQHDFWGEWFTHGIKRSADLSTTARPAARARPGAFAPSL